MVALSRYFDLLAAGDPDGLAYLFAGHPVIDDPRSGRIEGEDALAGFVREYREWMNEGRADAFAVTESDVRDVAEFVLHVRKDAGQGGDVFFPVAVAGDREDGAYAALRVYHSMWPLMDHHVVRPPLLDEDRSLVIPDVVGRYHRALTAGDLEGILATFDQDGYAREPAGGQYVYRGRERLREFYGLLFSNEGGILLEHCSVTDDGVRVPLEYNAVRWGKTQMPAQAGIAIYERGGSGLLVAARIYDDVDPPV